MEVHAFELVGGIPGVFGAPHNFQFKVYSDGGLAGAIVRVKTDRVQRTLSDSSFRTIPQEDEGDEYAEYYVTAGHAALDHVESNRDENLFVYTCAFNLIRADAMEDAELYRCWASLHPTKGMRGRLYSASVLQDVVVQEPQVFELQVRETVAPEQSFSILKDQPFMLPLTPGRYDCDGIKAVEAGFVYKGMWSLQLHDDGRIVGEGQHSILSNPASKLVIEGTWTKDTIQFATNMEEDSLSKQNKVGGKTRLGTLSGRWRVQTVAWADYVSFASKKCCATESSRFFNNLAAHE